VTSVDPEYVEARRVLLDALEALAPHAEALVIAGAQAVYLRVATEMSPWPPTRRTATSRSTRDRLRESRQSLGR
jgi:hypothetical protein